MSGSESCPYCGRWLATFHADGTCDLAPKAAINYAASGSAVTIDGVTLELAPVSGTATCYLWRCRLRRWWDR